MKRFCYVHFLLLFLFCIGTILFLPRRVSASSYQLSAKKITIVKGTSKKLAVLHTKKKISWTSSNKKIATVTSSGTVKGKKKGTASIRAKIGGTILTCKVTVINKDSLYVKKKMSAKEIKVLRPYVQDVYEPIAADGVKKINAYRKKCRLSLLKSDKTLAKMACHRLLENESYHSFSHVRPSGKSFATITSDYTYSCQKLCEIITTGKSVSDAIRSFRNSSAHRAILKDTRVTNIGFAVYKRKNGTYSFLVLLARR